MFARSLWLHLARGSNCWTLFFCVMGCRSGLKWFRRWCSNSWNLSPESQKVGTGLVDIAFSFGWHRFEAFVADRFLLWRGPWISDELLSSSRGSFCRSGWFCWFADVICSFVLWSCHHVRPAAEGFPGTLTRVIDFSLRLHVFCRKSLMRSHKGCKCFNSKSFAAFNWRVASSGVMGAAGV